MSDHPWTGITGLPASRVPRADAVCDQFEAAWRVGPRPRLEDYLEAATQSEHAALLRELIPLDADYRRRAGEIPSPAEYQQRFPALSPDWLAQVLAVPSVAADPTATAPTSPPAAAPEGQRLRCPHCHNPIQLQDDRPDEVLCPACGSSFRVRDARQTTTTGPMRQLGKFQLLERVGVGAFGAVWKARDTELDRLVALKIPHAGLLASPDELERFHREARAAAQLRHPGIVTVHEVVLLDGLPVLVADFIEGAPLRDLLQTRQLTFPEAAALVADVAEALDHAHGLGLVHRDIKPANIMLDYGPGPGAAAGNRLGRPLVMDFGLALRQDVEVTLTIEGQVLGTPAYMSPEQAAGHGHLADRRSDVYSLGVILYELLTGELPFRGSKAMLLVQVLREEPKPPRKINDKIPKDLETVCLKALAKEPARRYATARELADDLRRWLAGEPIRARPVGAWERGWRWCRRHPAAAALLVVSGVAALTLVGGVMGLWYHRQLQVEFRKTQQAQQAEADQRRQAEAALDEARRAREQAERFQYFHHLARAQAAWRDGTMGGVEKLLDDCPMDQRHWEWDYLKRQCHTDLLTLRGHPGGIFSVAFSPDGTRIASLSSDGTVKLWDATTGQETRTLTITDRCWSVAFSPDGTRLASSSDTQIVVWDTATGREVFTLTGGAWCVAFSPDGKRLASTRNDGTVKVWDATTRGEALFTLTGHIAQVFGIAFSPDGTRLASAGIDGTVKVWDATTERKALLTLTGHTNWVLGVAFSPDGTRLASASFDLTLRLWDATTGQEIRTLKGHTGGVGSVAFSPDGKWLASASMDQTVKIWDATTGQEARTLKGHTNQVRSVAFSPDGTRLASAGYDQTVKVWDATTGSEARILTGHTAGIWSVAFSPDGKRLASASTDRTVKIWDASSGQEIRTLKGHTHNVLGVAFSPDGTRLASASTDRTVKVWNASSGQEILTLKGHTRSVRGVAFSPDGTRLASAGSEGTVKVWDATTERQALLTLTHTDRVTGVAFSPDGTQLASAGVDRTVRIWDAHTGRELLHFKGQSKLQWFESVAFSPDRTLIASAEGDMAVIRDAMTGQVLHTLKGHTDQLQSVVFSPDGKRLASASFDGTVKLWEVSAGQEALTLRGHTRSVPSVAFSPDGKQLASASSDGTVKLWDARPSTPEAAIEREALGLLDYLFARPLCRADVLAHLNSSPTLRAEAREKARSLVGRYREETDPDRYHQSSWAVVRQRYLNALQYGFALRQAETACRLARGQGRYQTTLGTAQYRNGQYPQALASLTQAEQYHRAAAAGLTQPLASSLQSLAMLGQADQLRQTVPANLAFLALTQHQLGQKEQAQATMVRLRELLKKPHGANDHDAQAFLREAEALLPK